MSVPYRNRDASADPATAAPQQELTAPSVMSPSGRVPAPGAAPPGWVSVPLHGSVPLAITLLVAAVGTAILAMAVGATRITQLRRLSRLALVS
jgi:hypothetical protein